MGRQMRKTYETTNKLARIVALRVAAAECERQGFTNFAAANTELADLLQKDIDASAKAKLKGQRVEHSTDPEFTPPDISTSVVMIPAPAARVRIAGTVTTSQRP